MSYPIELARADRLHCVLEHHDWDFDRSRSVEIDRHWDERKRANPALYDGPVLLAHHARREQADEGCATFSVKFFQTRFSRFLTWREFGFPGSGVYNCFSMPALRSADGAFLVGEMGAQHSVPGAIYFPGGNPDPSDLRDGLVDLESSLLRELTEETGLSATEGRVEPDWTIVSVGPRIACIKIIDFPEPAATIQARVDRYLARQEHPELAKAHMIFRRSQLAEPRLLEFARGFLTPLLPE